MPIWHVYHPENLYSTKDKQQFAAQVTMLYAELIKLPKFYVSVAFHAFAPQDFFVGAEPATKFVRISIDHIARLTPDPEQRKKWMDTINERLAPFLRHRGLHWEIHVDETPRDFWTIDGFFPPPTGSPDERRWAEENKPSQPIGG
ncbi:tautomerase family protein [Streptomyces sp. NPDC059744]|uniref:tautomerase family protein n=1 Tax=Streptomyces sp. NPDC059744 TaxID=3346929 RepID=UPI00364E34C9